MADKPDPKSEALRLKTLAESTYSSSSLTSALNYATLAHNLCPDLPGLPELLAAFQILHSSKHSLFPFPDHYSILGLEPFSQISSVKSRYKKLALLLHPDKNKSAIKEASEEAFKVLNDAFQVLSDRVKKRQYDTNLRISLMEIEEGEREKGDDGDRVRVRVGGDEDEDLEMGFEDEGDMGGESDDGGVSGRRNDRVRVEEGGDEEDDLEMGDKDDDESVERVKLKRGEVIRVYERRSKLGHKKKGVLGTEAKRNEMPRAEERTQNGGKKAGNDDRKRGSKIEDRTEGEKMIEEETMSAWLKRVRTNDRGFNSAGTEMVVFDDGDEELTLAEMVKSNDGELTLAEMKLEALRKKKGEAEGEKKKKVTMREENENENENGTKNIGRTMLMGNGDMEVMTVEDSDFYDFDKDRVERSFKKGQVWAIYDDDDGMPRHYGLIDEVVSVNPFEVKMSWLDLQNSTDERMLCLEKMGVHVSCGRFKAAKKDTVKLLNIFSHRVECERAARELYRIYPRKGSMWALYRDRSVDIEELERNSSGGSRRRYDIVVFLTSYSEMHGLSMAYLEKVEGYRAVFKRKEVGYHAVRWLEKDDISLFSHQIPARKLSSDDAPHIEGDCWELDPASVPPNLLTLRG